MNNPKVKARREIGLALKALREARLLSQAELAKRLDISQAGLSKIERGESSLNTEDFLEVLRIFNVPASHFYPKQYKGDHESVLQNALARLGADHLYENDSLPSENLEQVNQVIREVLVDGRNPRHLVALAPVIVAQISRIHLNKLWAEFINLGLERRLGWLLENTLEALKLAPRPKNHTSAWNYRRAETVLQQFTNNIQAQGISPEGALLQDVIGTSATTSKTLNSLESNASSISREWGILSPIQVQDFVDALKASHDAA